MDPFEKDQNTPPFLLFPLPASPTPCSATHLRRTPTSLPLPPLSPPKSAPSPSLSQRPPLPYPSLCLSFSLPNRRLPPSLSRLATQGQTRQGGRGTTIGEKKRERDEVGTGEGEGEGAELGGDRGGRGRETWRRREVVVQRR
ncbi:hypothetical protein AAC387_Pa05g1635 [Persea americana]